MKLRHLLVSALLASGCDASAPAPRRPSANLGLLRALTPLEVRAPLPANAKVEDVSQPGFPRRVAVTSMEPELIVDVEEVDRLSPSYDEVMELATSRVAPDDRMRVQKDERRRDGSFTVIVEHASLHNFTVDARVTAGEAQFDCSGIASSREVAARLEATCEALQPL